MQDSDREAQLRQIQEMALDHTVDEMRRADECDLDTREGRGDRSWLVGLASKSLGVAVRIEQFLELRQKRNVMEPEEDLNAAADRLISKARADVQKVLGRVKVPSGD